MFYYLKTRSLCKYCTHAVIINCVATLQIDYLNKSREKGLFTKEYICSSKTKHFSFESGRVDGWQSF